MMRFFLLLLFYSPFFVFSQVNHWETIVNATSQWRYIVPSSQPNALWKTVGFDDSQWLSGAGGIGYGDGDDNTIISNTKSVFLRKEFNVTNVNDITTVIFNMDFDDGFVAYLNGIEIARENLGNSGSFVAFSQNASAEHEAQMYQGGYPNTYQILSSIVNLQLGTNVLAVEVHNYNLNSSDLTARPYLHVGLSSAGITYNTPQTWFVPPFSSSNLPIIKINTNNQSIQDDPRIIANMQIINNASGLNFINDLPNEYNGNISIEIRGSSSQGFPKKSYALETQDSLGNNNNVELLGMPEENDWILYAPYTDKSLMRNVLTFELGRRIGKYTPRTAYCELFINYEYVGIYVLMESIKIDKNRVDIATLNPEDTIGDQLTGGYIVKIDKTTGSFNGGWISPYTTYGGNNLNLQFHRPKGTDLHVSQRDYIENYITNFENAISSSNFNDPILGYQSYIDVASFMDLYLINELSKNIDGYRLSTFLYKDKDSKGGKIYMGPWWDYNLSFGNADYCQGFNTQNWEIETDCAIDNPFWFERLLEDENYRNLLKCKWTAYRADQWSDTNILLLIDSIANYIDEAKTRNFNKWQTLGTYVWPNYYIGQNYNDEVQYLKTWIQNRMAWIDMNILGTCIEGCTDATACNYNPNAVLNDGTCIFAPTYYDCFGNCINDTDGDLICDETDNCPNLSNPSQIDLNMNGIGDACDIANNIDNINGTNTYKIKAIYDLWGRKVTIQTKGIIIIQYENGKIEKRINL